ncbi:cation transport protein domain-containing protein [Trichoderma breve]|uniref:Potassium transport protein n=1 Tax=Trichoderma breve TaxID=2034170 RepID=A0A9W9E9S1_9HYPO|nr:cation transport protein domain-containing protein [Trichoderma breve]KAJ4860436.1 cation transport protein domain-containing protein [Trichoderma breve]
MFDDTRAFIAAQIKGAKPAFVSKTPHFNFITVHYFWIIFATLLSGILIYAGGKGELHFIDALMFGSGANTQAGLNPVDVNNLNGFQQSWIYTFSLLSNPITLHTCVVFLRLYWFEKRFQNWAKEARMRRRTLSKSKSKARNDLSQLENGLGVNGRHITIVPRGDKANRITNDVSDDLHKSVSLDDIDPLDQPRQKDTSRAIPDGNDSAPSPQPDNPPYLTTAITFADTVKRSDGLGSDPTKFPQRRPNAEHIAILERQRNQDNEVLRIPGPRETERGLGPRRLEEDDQQEEEDRQIARQRTIEFRNDEPSGIHGRQPTITIAEPEHHKRDELKDDVAAAGNVVDSLRFRRPRFFNRSQDKLHEDGEEPRHERSRTPHPHPVRTRTMDTIRSALTREKVDDMPYLSYTPTMGRNSNFLGLTLEQREELGGIEYRALRTLALVLLFYFWMFHILAVVCLLPYILHNQHYGNVLTADDIGKTWWAFWTANVAFMDVGFTLTPDSMNSFATSEWVLMAMWFFIIIGNTGFPVMLRFMIWVASKLTPRGTGLWEEFRFLLDHPRRCFTLLFPSNANWWLFWILVLLNVIDLVFFIVLDLGAEPITAYPLRNRVVIGLFQAASTRTAGFSAVSMSELHPAMPVLYMIMMYISVFPIAISIRRTNVYEEKSLGVYRDRDSEDAEEASALDYVGTHLRRQLSFDLCAYGTVGLSMGVPGVNASLCSQFSVVGKLIIVAMQIRGRHRGLPYGLDRAVILPSEARLKKEQEESEAALARTNTAVSTGATSALQRHVTTGRSRSRSRDRANGSLITQLLHPGPVVPPDPFLRPRGRSVEGHQRSMSADVTGALPEPAGAHLHPSIEEDDELHQLSSNDFPHKPRRIESSAF